MFKLPSNVKYRVFDKNFKGSTGKYLIKDDKATAEEVKENRNSICVAQGVKEIAILRQVHGSDVYYATNATEIGAEPEVDAAYTDKKGIVLAIQTADCVPVLITDKTGSIIGAAHCGWKSAFQNILENLVNQMQKKMQLTGDSTKLMAIIGPSIHQESYEVTKDYFDVFLEESPQNARFFIPSTKAEHFMFDLSGYVRLKLEALGVVEIYHIYEDTYTNADKYPSYRRHCHTGEEYGSSILSTIVMH